MSLRKKWLLALIFVFLLQATSLQTLVWAADSDQPTLKLVSETPITSGAILKQYIWNSTRKGKPIQVDANVIQVDLQNPLVKLDVMTGTNNQFTKKQTVRGMANETGAVAGVNGDFFDTQAEGVPIGPEIAGGKLMATPPFLPGFYTFAIDKDNKPIVDLFTFQGQIRTKDGATYPLGGINKTYYWFEPSGEHSMIDGLYMYTDAWGQVDRSNDGVTVPTEILVQNGIIRQIAPNSIIDMIPPKDGYILRASGKAAEFAMAHMKVGDPIFADYQVLPQDPSKNYDVKNFKMMIGGGTILVDQGQPAEFTRTDADDNGYRSRTAVGYAKDQRYVYLITVDHSATSYGMSLKELQQLMIKLGVWKGMNLDGGGSTQMVARPLGEFQTVLVNKTENDSERKVVNGLGVYSVAPPGKAKEFTIQGETNLLINEKASFQLKGYDEYYNPIHMENATPTWQVSNDVGSFQGQYFVGTKPGATVLTATYGEAKQSIKVQVIGRDQIASMKIRPSSLAIYEDSSIKLPVTITFKDGSTRTAPPESIQWELKGVDGKMDGDTLRVGKLGNAKYAQIIARYDGFSTMVTLPVGERKLWADFDNVNQAVSFENYPSEVKGDVSLMAGLAGKAPTDRSLNLRYDFTQGTGTKAAYAAFGSSGVRLEGEPQSMRVNVLGDNSLNWLRAEIVDGNGKSRLVDLGSKIINWTGWKTVDTDLSALNLTYPITLKRIYVANPEQGQDERLAKGAIAIDDISFLYKGKLPESPKSTIKLTIDKNTMIVNNNPITIDQPPVIVNDNTLVPVRFVIEALGGQIVWNNEERKVTVLKDDHLFDLWLDQKDLIMDGDRVTAEVAPQLINERTMVPLRLLSEKLGWKVTWDNDTRSVTLE